VHFEVIVVGWHCGRLLDKVCPLFAEDPVEIEWKAHPPTQSPAGIEAAADSSMRN